MTLKDVFEPVAVAGGEATPDLSVEAVAVVSLAISAKRIADLLDSLTDHFAGDKAQLRVGANCDVRPAP